MPDPAPYSEADGRLALRDHVREKAAAARERFPVLNKHTLGALLQDRSVVRYPVDLAYDITRLQPGEVGYLQQLGDHPAEGFRLFLHPGLEYDARLPLAVAYYIPSINYGEIVSFEEAELFGATLAGMQVESLYETLCSLAESLWGVAP